ncbi:hypothetical protein M3Y99_01440900 [Aphelenchoides fujianensis]|nr:hypothetical protein M3Y99_01440900 [Aphelenchoides fujianensis]
MLFGWLFLLLLFPALLMGRPEFAQLDGEFADLPPPPQFESNEREQQEFFLPERPPERDEGGFFLKAGPLSEHPYFRHELPPARSAADFPNRFTEQIFGNMPPSDTAKCFSCMSKFYEAVWPALAHVYKKPMNFTDDCNDETIDQRLVPITHCPTICVAMSEESTVAGVKIRGFIRGCADDLLINGFNQTIVAWYRWMHRDACRVYGKRELFKLPFEQSDESSIQVCTCYSDFCNVAADHSASLKGRWGALAVCLFATLLAEMVGGR